MRIYLEYEKVKGSPKYKTVDVKNIIEGIDEYDNFKEELIKENQLNITNDNINNLVIYCQLRDQKDRIIMYNNIIGQ